MPVPSAWRVLPVLASVAVVAAMVGSADRSPQDFFTIRIATTRSGPYLYGEAIDIYAEVRNETGKPLTYLATSPRANAFISGIVINVTRGGELVLPAKHAGPLFPRGHPIESSVRTLPSGGVLRQTGSLENEYAFLPPGTYTIQATLEQHDPFLGLTTGKARSNKIVLTIRDWKPKAYLEKVWESGIGPTIETCAVRLMETSDGDTLLYWREDEHGVFHDMTVLRIPRKVHFHNAWWKATDHDCYVVCGQPEARKRLLITANRGRRSVRVFYLEPGRPVRRAGAEAWIW